MKSNSLVALIAILIITSFRTTAQTSFKPFMRVPADATRQAYRIHSFDVQLQQDNNNRKFILAVNNPFGEKLKISVSGNAGVGFNDRTSDLTYRKRINLENAEDGIYTVTVASDEKTFTKTIPLGNEADNRNSTLQ